MEMEAAAAPADESTSFYHPPHGTYPGHMLPGTLFLIMGIWWTVGVLWQYLTSNAKTPYKCRVWHPWPFWPYFVPLEPLLMTILPFIGANLELYFGHVSYRYLHDPETQKFVVDNLQDWQHSAMYAAFMLAGIVSLLGYYTHLPAGTEHVFLGMAFIIEGTLFGFHLKGNELDRTVHFILVLTIFVIAFFIFMEIQHPTNVLVSLGRGLFTTLQGIWFMQVACILYKEYPWWDSLYMGSHMFAPVVYCFYICLLTFLCLVAFLLLRFILEWSGTPYRPVLSEEPDFSAPVEARREAIINMASLVANGHSRSHPKD